MVEYRPMKIKSVCPLCQLGRCWDCVEVVVMEGSKRVPDGTEVMCACHAGHHQWKPQPVFPRKPRSET